MLCCCCSVTQLCLTLCNPMVCSMPGFPVLHYLPEFAQTDVHWVGDAIQSSHSLLPPSPASIKVSIFASIKPSQCIKKHRHHFANKDLYSQSCGFSRSHVWMWELDHKEGWALKNWCFQTVVLEKTLQRPLDSKEIKPVNPKGN